MKRCPNKMPPGKKPPRKLPPSPENYPRKDAPQKNCHPDNFPRKNATQENCSPENCPFPPPLPPKLFYQSFVASVIFLQLFILKLFIVTSFRGISRTPATSIIDLLATVVNGINQYHKKLLFRCQTKLFKDTCQQAHRSASDTR